MIRRNITATLRASVLPAVIAVAFALFASLPAWALTGEDVLDKMSADHRIGYLSGSIGMAAFLSSVEGDKDRADCIMTWFYEESGTKTIISALERYKDREALPIIQALIERECKQ